MEVVIYAKLSSPLLSVPERGVAVNMQGTGSTIARVKMVPSYHEELVSHPTPEHIEAS